MYVYIYIYHLACITGRMQYTYMQYIHTKLREYLSIVLYHHHRFKVGTYPKCKLRFSRCFGGGLENVSLHFEGILKTLPTKTTPGGR